MQKPLSRGWQLIPTACRVRSMLPAALPRSRAILPRNQTTYHNSSFESAISWAAGTDYGDPMKSWKAFKGIISAMEIVYSKGPKANYPWVLKGGYAMELRIRSARTTKDIDLTLHDGTRVPKNPRERGGSESATSQYSTDFSAIHNSGDY